jgi:hypothetical protein
MKNVTESILIFTNEPLTSSSENETKRGVKTKIKSVSSQIAYVAVNELEKNMSQFLNNLNTIISNSPKEVGGLALDEIEIHANIDSKGNISLLGILGAELVVQGGIKFVLRRKMQ